MASPFDALADELVVHILSFCETADLDAASHASLRFARIVGDDLLWRRAFERKWKCAWSGAARRVLADTWRGEYTERQRLLRAWQCGSAPQHRVYPGIGVLDCIALDLDHRAGASVVVASAAGGEARRLSLAGRAARRSTPVWPPGNGVSATAMAAGHGAVLCGTSDGRVRIVRLVEGGDRIRIPTRAAAAGMRVHEGRVACASVVAADWALAGGHDGRVSVWRMSACEQPVVVAGPVAGAVAAVAGVVGGAVAAVSHVEAADGAGSTLTLWDWDKWDAPVAVKLPRCATAALGVAPVALAGTSAQPAHSAFGICGADDAAAVWWTDAARALRHVDMPTARCVSAACAGAVAVGCASGAVAVVAPWGLRGIEELRPRGHRSAVGAVDLDVFKVVSACAESVRVWDRMTLDCLRQISLRGSLADRPPLLMAVGPMSIALVDANSRALAVRTWDLTLWASRDQRGDWADGAEPAEAWSSASQAAAARVRRRSGGRRHSGSDDPRDAHAEADYGCREWADMASDSAAEGAARARLARRYHVEGLTDEEALQLAISESMGSGGGGSGGGGGGGGARGSTISREDYVSPEEERQLLWALAASQLDG